MDENLAQQNFQDRNTGRPTQRDLAYAVTADARRVTWRGSVANLLYDVTIGIVKMESTVVNRVEKLTR